MQELMAKLQEKKTTTQAIQAKKFITFDICNPFISSYRRTTELAYWKLQELLQIFYSG